MQTVTVEGVGSFQIQRRTMRVQLQIASEYNRLVEGADQVSAELGALASFMAFLKVMVVSGPDGWDPYGVDADDAEAQATLRKVYSAIDDADARFREKPQEKPQEAGA